MNHNPSSGIPRAVLLLLYLLSCAVAAISPLFVLFTPFLFDAPGSAANPVTLMLLAAIVSLPLVALLVRFLTKRALADYSRRRLVIALALVFAWIAYAGIVAIALDASCDSLKGCE